MIPNLKVLEKNAFLKPNIFSSVVVFLYNESVQALELDIDLNTMVLKPSFENCLPQGSNLTSSCSRLSVHGLFLQLPQLSIQMQSSQYGYCLH